MHRLRRLREIPAVDECGSSHSPSNSAPAEPSCSASQAHVRRRPCICIPDRAWHRPSACALARSCRDAVAASEIAICRRCNHPRCVRQRTHLRKECGHCRSATPRSCRALRWSQNMRHPSVEGRAVIMVERSKGVNLRAQRIDHHMGDQTPPVRPGDRKHRGRSRTALAPAYVSFTPGWSICRKAEGIFFGSRYPIRIRSTLRRALSNS